MAIVNTPIWGRTDAPPLPELTGDIAADVCVVGLGGSGLTCIGELLSRGKRVVGVDALTVAGGAAGRNGGFLLGGLAMFHHDAVERLGRVVATALYEQTLMQIDRIASETPDVVVRTGSVRRAESAAEAQDCEQQYDAMRRDGLPVERVDGTDACGLVFPADASFDPDARCQVLAARAVARGAQLFAHSPATFIGDGRVDTPRGSVRARHVVVAVDGALEVILPELATRVRSARLQMLATAPALDVSVPRPVYSRWGLDYWQQLADGRIVLGGGRDVGGSAEWTTDDRPTEAVQRALDAIARDVVGTAAPVTHRWAATVGYTPSGLPILEEARPGVWAIGGYSGTGNIVGALCGRAVAEVITDGRSPLADLLRA